LRVPKWETGCDANEKIEKRGRLVLAARVVMPINCGPARANRKRNINFTFCIGSISFGVSSSGVEDPHKKKPDRFSRGKHPERTAEPFPHLENFRANESEIRLSKILHAIAARFIVDPSLTTINSLSGAFAVR